MQKDFITATPDSGTGDGTVTVSASANTGLERNSSINISGGGITRTINISQKSIPNGVYICDNNGQLWKKTDWSTSNNSNASGVAVKTNNCAFVIAKKEQTSIQWGGFNTLINGCTTTTDESTAKKDYSGKQNTDAIVSQLGESDTYAARYCKEYTFPHGVQGYLPALGEWYEVYQNILEVNACMSLIGGDPLYDSSIGNYVKWSSTQYSATNAWGLYSVNSGIQHNNKAYGYNNFCARPFAPF